jgi:ATP-dependent helicase/nuclease subunit B
LPVAEAYRPAVYTIPPHRAFADALAAGLIAEHGGDPLRLARGIVLLPNARATRAITDAFVRRAGGGLLLPRMVPVGDPELDERLGSLFDPAGRDLTPIPPAVEPLTRLMLLTRLVGEARAASGDPVGTAEAARLAADLARTIDQLHVEEVAPSRLADAVPAELSEHWQRSIGLLRTILDAWGRELVAIGRIDLAARRNLLLARVASGWREAPPPGFVVAAGITTTAPAVARLLRTVSRLERGMVVLPGLDCEMPAEEWDELGPHPRENEENPPKRSIETHPQFQLKQLLDRMDVARGEVRRWRWGGGRTATAARTRAIANAMAPAAYTGKWHDLPVAARRLTGVRAAEFANPAEEAQAMAVAMREAIETAGRTVALVTPDRALARRVVAHLGRWNIRADDSAGRPLSTTAPGTLLIGLAEAAASAFAPVPLLALLKHPLVRAGEGRLNWLEGVRRLDRALRGPRPPTGLAGMARYLAEGQGRDRAIRVAAQSWWSDAAALLAPIEAVTDEAPAGRIAVLREVATMLCGDALWAGPDGRAAAELIAGLEEAAPRGPQRIAASDLALLLRQLMDDIAVRPPQGGHPRLFVWGLIEARLQHADLMILSGLNEGTWPSAPAPDPWLAPAIRATLGLPGLERRIGLAAHDFASALGAGQVLVTRARRDARAPAIASRFWLRLEAMTGGLARAPLLPRLARALDRPAEFRPATRPAPAPPVEDRPRRIAVTSLDRLKADPFAFYAAQMLRLSSLDMVDADPSPAWRGNAVHAVFEAWMKEDGCDPAKLRPRAKRMLGEIAAHPVLRALWTPRLLEAIDFTAETVAANLAAGRRPIAAEISGKAEIGAIRLDGKVDRIDADAAGRLAIVDYKTGKPPGKAQVAAGYALQLGLLGLIVEAGGFDGVAGVPAEFEYWSLARGKGGALGFVESPVGVNKAGEGIAAEDFTAHARSHLDAAVARWLTGRDAFTAKLHPEFAPYGDYDQLMRLDEWYGRSDG